MLQVIHTYSIIRKGEEDFFQCFMTWDNTSLE